MIDLCGRSLFLSIMLVKITLFLLCRYIVIWTSFIQHPLLAMALGEPTATSRFNNLLTRSGQGTVVATFYRCTPFSIRIRPAQLNSAYEDSDEVKDKRGYVEVQILKDKAVFANRKSGSKTVAVQYGKCTDEKGGLAEGKRVSYCLSYDRNQRILKYGKGYVMEETTLLTEQFPFPEKKGQDP